MGSNLPLIVQSDRTMLLEVDHPGFEDARDAVCRFAELITSPEHYHTYRITALSLWNAASSGITADHIIESLQRFSRYPVPENVLYEIRDQVGRYGKIRLTKIEGEEDLLLESDEDVLITQFFADKRVKSLLKKRKGKKKALVEKKNRGELKQALIKLGFPVEDLSGYIEGASIDIALREETLLGAPFALRQYQEDAIRVFYAEGDVRGGSGVLVLPCGAGKTVIGIGTIDRIGQKTLILTTNITALRQWRDELINKTTINPEDVGEYSGEVKEIRPITITTYQILTYHKHKGEEFIHMGLFEKENWGLIIYDEVHLLPAPVFRATADLQARRRLGLTATLVREDGREDEVFSLIGPKKVDVPWKTLESQGWIAQANCREVRVPLTEKNRMDYAVADTKAKFRLAAENSEKIGVARQIIRHHEGESIMVIGQYLNQLYAMADEFEAPLITGKTPSDERGEIYAGFKDGSIKLIIVSKVANFAVDLPTATVAIQVSGTFGSRQEEAQRLGRVLRPKDDGRQAYFYSIVTEHTRECEFASKRQLFLTEQGYRYKIVNHPSELFGTKSDNGAREVARP